MSWFTETATFEREIEEPISGDKATVTLRALNAADYAVLQDTLRMEARDIEGVEEVTPQMLLGTMKMLTVKRAVVKWSLPIPATPQTIESLHPAVFEQIYQHVSFGGEEPLTPTQPEPEAAPEPEAKLETAVEESPETATDSSPESSVAKPALAVVSDT